MMRLKLLLLPILIFISSFNLTKATHIVGGEMNYKFLGVDGATGKNIYQIRLTMYRDCYVGVPPFDNPAVMGIFDVNNNFIDSVWLPFLGLDTLPPQINDPCTIPPTNFCYEVTTYIDTIMLAPLTGGYIISYQRCCRNSNLLNIVSPTCTGATYWAHIPGPEVVAIDGNPVFKNWPPPFICANKPWVFDNSAIDPEGDSLVYELYTPYTGLDASCPIVTTTAISPQTVPGCPVAASCPNLPVNPPFTNVVWNPPYGLANMLGGVPLTVNSATGLVTATPNTLGYFVFGIKCKEYRNGVLIGEILRDFQLIVLPCPSLVVAAASVPSVICGTNSATFTNLSDSTYSNNYFWNFGDTTNSADTSDIKSPTYLYPDTGVYNYYLVAYSNSNAACTDTFFSSVTFSAAFNGNFTFATVPCVYNILYYTATVNAPSNTTPNYYWIFGDGYSVNGPGPSTIPAPPPITNTTGTYQNPVHTYPPSSGTYQVTLEVGIPGSLNCYDTIQTQVVSLADSTVAAASVPNVICGTNLVTFTNNSDSTYASGYFWSFGDPTTQADTSHVYAPSYLYPDTGIFAYYLVAYSIANPACSDTFFSSLTLGSQFAGNFNFHTEPCIFNVVYFDYSVQAPPGTTAIYSWNFGDGFSISGAGSATIPSTPNTNTTGTYSNPVHTYPSSSATYQILLSTGVPGSLDCYDTVQVQTVAIGNAGDLFVPNTFTPNGDGKNDVFRARGPGFGKFYFAVYNRWGQMIWETHNPADGWDGTFNGMESDPGVFGWYLRASCAEGKEEVFRKGNVTLVR